MAFLPNLRTWSRIDELGHPSPILTSPDIAVQYFALEDSIAERKGSQAFIDTPQILYSNWLKRAGGIEAALGSFITPPKIVLIGGGLANCVAGLELAKAGADVTLLEVSDHVGGRLQSILSPDKVNYQEMGAMRFPPSEDVLYYYAKHLGFAFVDIFPNPGSVDTLISYKGEVKLWPKKSPTVPDGFKTVHDGWQALVSRGITVKRGDNDINEFLAPAELTILLQRSFDNNPTALRDVISGWQKYLTTFGTNTFLQGLRRIFGKEHEWNIPGGIEWSEEDFDRFGKLGVGSGGFGAFFSLGFNAILRIVVNGLETDQKMFAKVDSEGQPQPTGIQNLAEAIVDLASDPTKQRTPLKVLLRTAGAIWSSTPNSLTVTQAGFHPGLVTYDYAIVGTTSKAAYNEVLIKIHGSIDPTVANALRTVHVCASSKLFIRTNRFWETTPGTPRVILSDGPVNQLYTLDYAHPDKGLVLVVYAWEQDSINLQGFTVGPQLFQYLFEQLRAILSQSQEWAKWVEHLIPFDSLNFKHWQLDPRFMGAFVIAGPSQDGLLRTLFYDHRKLLPKSTLNNSASISTLPTTKSTISTSTPVTLIESHDSKPTPSPSTPTAWSPILLNGDSYGWSGGWTQGALEMALNNVSVILKARGQINQEAFAPTSLLKPDTYDYGAQ